MRGFLRSPAPFLLLILAIPVIAIRYIAGAGSQQQAAGTALPFATACLSISIAVVLIDFRMRSGLRGKPIPQGTVVRHQIYMLLAGDFLIDAFAILAAPFSPAFALIVCAIAAAWVLLWSPPTFRRRRVVSTVVIQRSPGVVFSFVSDFRNLPRWYPNIDTVEMLTTGPIGPGTRFREQAHLPSGPEFEGVDEIVEYEPNRRLTSRVLTMHATGSDVIELEPVGAGTRLSHGFGLEIPISGALLGEIWRVRGLMPGMVSRREQASAQIKALLESSEFGSAGT